MNRPLPFDDEYLIRYLDGELNEAEKIEVESELNENNLLWERLESLRVAITAVRQHGTSAKVRSIHNEMMDEMGVKRLPGKISKVRRITRYSLAAAASILLVFLAFKGFQYFSQPGSEQLFNEAFVDYEISAIRGTGDLSEAEMSYAEKNYSAVTDLAATADLSEKDSLLIGLSYLHLKVLPAATTWFKNISSENTYAQDAEFYLALTYIRSNNFDQAFEIIQNIQTHEEHLYHKQFSRGFLEKLERKRKQD